METAQKTLSADADRLKFLYNRISMPRVCMAAWLRVPEFVKKITALDAQGIIITDALFLEVAEPILNEKLLHKKDNQDLRLPTLKRGLVYLRKGDYEE